jgi:hypothetical protein
LIALVGSRAGMGIVGTAVLPWINDADGKSVFEWRFAVYDVRGKADTEIRRYSSAKSPVRFDRVVFPRRQPEFYMRQFPANLYDILQVLDALQVSRIMPPEVPVAGSVNQGTYRFDPALVA